MVIYEHSTNSMHILWAVLMIVIVIFLIVGIFRFSPLLKKTIALLAAMVDQEKNETTPTGGHMTQVLFMAIFTLLLYGTLGLGVVFGIKEATESIQSRIGTSHVYSISGEVEIVESTTIDYRGNTLGHSLHLSLEGMEFIIEDPPGITTESLNLLTSGSKIVLQYQVKDSTNIIVRIEVLP